MRLPRAQAKKDPQFVNSIYLVISLIKLGYIIIEMKKRSITLYKSKITVVVFVIYLSFFFLLDYFKFCLGPQIYEEQG